MCPPSLKTASAIPLEGVPRGDAHGPRSTKLQALKSLVLTAAWALSLASVAQVPNGDFEAHSDCPTLTGQMDRATGWYSPTMGTPDYFNACGSPDAGVPDNFFGSEPAHSGNAYAGLIVKNSTPSPEWREYMQIELAGPLLTGIQYELRMQLSLAEYSQFGSSAIAGLLTTVPVSRSDNFRFNLLPQATNPVTEPVLNKDGWVSVNMPFVADSAYQYLTVGNFLDDANTPAIPVAGGATPRAYFYIDDVTLGIAPFPQIQGTASICTGDSTTLTAVNAPDPAWALSSAPATIISTDPSITVSPDSTTTYLLYGATDTAHATVVVHPYPTVDLGNDSTLCQGEMLTLDATTPNADYLWPDSSTSPIFNVGTSGTYYVQVSVHGCAASDTVEVNFLPAPTLNLGHDTALCHGQTMLLDATTAGATYLWQDNSTGATFLAEREGTYGVTLTVNGCSTTDSISITMVDCSGTLEMPNVFTPNHDGRNDLFTPISFRGIGTMHTTIRNRWGQVVFETDRPAIGWDGKDAAEGTYFWEADYVDADGNGKRAVGHVLLLR